MPTRKHAPSPRPTITDKLDFSFEDTSIAFAGRSDAWLKKTLWMFGLMNNEKMMNASVRLMQFALKFHLPFAKLVIRKTIFGHFCGGQTLQTSAAAIESLAQSKIGTILDYSVEGEDSQADFDATLTQTLEAIFLASKQPDQIPFCVFKTTGLASTDLLKKIQSKDVLSDAQNQDWERAKARIDQICKSACVANVKIFIDGEESWIQSAIDDIARQMMEKYNTQTCIVFNTWQLYRWDALPNLQQSYYEANMKNYLLGVKLVRGAYMEKERAYAVQNKTADPIQPTKQATDHDFDQAIEFCLDNLDYISFCVGSHNENSTLKTARDMMARKLSKDNPKIWFAQLYGMSDNITYNLAKAGYNVAKYVPYGPVAAVMPYLVRRAQENSSIAGQTGREYNLLALELKRRKELKIL